MIIEAAPRLRDGPLEDNSILPSQSPCSCKLVLSNYGNESTTLIDFGKTKAELLDSTKNTSKHKWRKSCHREHPYEREHRSRRSCNKRKLLSTVPVQKCPLTLQHENTVSNRTESTSFTPIFTANANENNDNCPNATYCTDDFAITRNKLNESPALDNICDIEIEDLTTTGPKTTHYFEESNTWRQRRKSLNTNPLSSIETRELFEKTSSLKQLENLLQSGNKGSNLNNIFDNFCTEEPVDIFTQSSERSLLYEKEIEERRKVQEETSSIEKLVEFFEANSTSIPFCKSVQNIQNPSVVTKPDLHRYGDHNLPNCNSRNESICRCPFQQAQGQRPSSAGITSQHSRNCNTNFVQLLHNNWDSVIGSPSRHLHTNTNTSHNIPEEESGGIYNNNANAASAPPETKFFWPGYQQATESYTSIGERYQNSRKASPSPVYFAADCGRCTSSLARVSSDVELIDLESTRFSSWPGTHSIPHTFDRQQDRNSLRFDSLIDLQTTSRRASVRSNDWTAIRNSNFGQKSNRNTQGSPCFTSDKTDKSQDRLQNSFCREAQESRLIGASANNHHNASWSFSEFERSIQNRIREKQIAFENLNFHHALLNPLLRKQRTVFYQSDSNDMGCIQSIAKAKVSPDRCHHSVIVEDIQAAIDQTPTEIEEKSSIVLRYRTPYFRASAHVIVPPIPRKETWTVGWIQACDSMKFINQYGNLGNSSWEIPALKDRTITAVSDSDGVSYPWYGNTTEIATVEGPTDTSRSLTLRMNDNFYPSVTWDIPVSEGSEAHLTHISRDQTFTTWLAAVNQTTGRLEVLRTVKWHFYLEIEVDPTQELGRRARIVSPLVQKQPIILKNNTEPVYISSPHRTSSNSSSSSGRQKRLSRRPWPGGDNNSNNHTNFIPKSALVRPSANNAQTLIWRPTRDVPVIVVPAKEEYKENNEVVWFTRQPTVHGHDHNVRVLSLQEMTQIKKSIS